MRDRTPIFMLHRLEDSANGVGGHSIEYIKSVLAVLRASGAKFVSLRTLVQAWRDGTAIDPDWVAFTVDDGFADQAVMVEEAFAPFDCPVTIFLITGFLDSKLWPWDDQLMFMFQRATAKTASITAGTRTFSLRLDSPESRSDAASAIREHCKTLHGFDPYAWLECTAVELGVELGKLPPAHHRPMTWDKARALESAGLAEFGPHSVTHRIFSRLSPEQSRLELQTSWSRLKEELRNPLSIFAWPTGRPEDFTARDEMLARNIGLHASVGTRPDYAYRGRSRPPKTLFGMNRFYLPNDLTTVLRYGSWLERGRQLLPI
jgi:peptidoglycan/xylan/chitin deacetylase (PgdA/CDA1 family)